MKCQALRSPALNISGCPKMFTFGISSGFPELSPASWQITHVLRTLAPLNITNIATRDIPLDLHVLSTPPAFVPSQNQTLRQKLATFARGLLTFKFNSKIRIKSLILIWLHNF